MRNMTTMVLQMTCSFRLILGIVLLALALAFRPSNAFFVTQTRRASSLPRPPKNAPASQQQQQHHHHHQTQLLALPKLSKFSHHPHHSRLSPRHHVDVGCLACLFPYSNTAAVTPAARTLSRTTKTLTSLVSCWSSASDAAWDNDASKAANNEEIKDKETNSSSTSSSVVSATFNLVKAILGAGCLALPAGLAAISDNPNMLYPANLLLLGMGILSAYTFGLYGRLAHSTGGTTASEIWQNVYTTSKKSTLLSVSYFVFCFGACLTYSLIIGDFLSSLMRAFGVTGWMASRQTAILGVTGSCLFPLCNLSSLAALAPISLLGVMGTLVVTIFLALRCPAVVASSPYSTSALKASTSLLATLPKALQPQFRTYNRIKSPAPLILIAMGCVAWMAHFLAPELYHSLTSQSTSSDIDEKARADNSNSTGSNKNNSAALKKFAIMTIAGYLMVAVFNVLTLSLGFLTFGGNSAGIILNNYATSDWGASLSRLLITVSVVGSFPFLFGACRSAAIDLFGTTTTTTKDDNGTASVQQKRKFTAVLLSIITTISLVIQDAGFAVAFNGALMGTAIIYIFPSLLFLKKTSTQLRPRGFRLRLERWLCRALIGFGAVSAVIGAVTAVLNSYFPHVLR